MPSEVRILPSPFRDAGVAQVVEREPSKLGVAGSIPVSRFYWPPGARALLARCARCGAPIPPDPAPHAAKPRAASGGAAEVAEVDVCSLCPRSSGGRALPW